MKGKLITIGIVVILVLTGLTSVSGITVKKENNEIELVEKTETTLKFSNPILDASFLDINGIIKNDQLSNLEFDSLKTKEFDFKISDCSIDERESGYYYFNVEGLQPYGSSGQPMLPMKTISFELPKNTEVIEVVLTDAKYQEIENKIKIATMPEPLYLGDSDTAFEDYIEQNIKPKLEIYTSENYFPGNALNYRSGKTNSKNIVNVQLLPTQYIPKTGKLVLITSGQIKVLYNNVKEEIIESTSQITAKNLIITHPSFYEQALDLKEFHDDQGTETEVVKTTWIGLNYRPAENPPFNGYKNLLLKGRNVIKSYNYQLAKKIVTYLRDTENHPNLEYVTLMGNGIHVPPSYYYFDEGLVNEEHFSFVPTDFFYSSPDHDLVPNYYIGRLPVHTVEEATHVVNKIKNWDSTDLFSNISVAGGKAFGYPYILGELIPLQSINRGYFDGAKITKYFETNNEFNKENVLKTFSGGSGLFYHFGHGNVNLFDAGPGDILYPEDIMNLPASSRTPIVASPACSDGKYDTYVAPEVALVSFGEAVLLSEAGGIAYIGGSRLNFEGSLFQLNNGRMDFLKARFFSAALTNVMQGFYEGRDTLGNITANAMYNYQMNNNMSDIFDLFTFFSFVLLGDPALKIPEMPDEEPSYNLPSSEVIDPVAYIRINETSSYPVIGLNETATLSSQTDSPIVNIKTLDPNRLDNFILKEDNVTTISENLTYNFSSNSSILFKIRFITEDGKEDWLYLTNALIVDDNYNSSTPGYGESRWSKIQDAINSIDIDFYYNQIVYVLNGTYNENILVDRNIELVGENNFNTIIDGSGSGDVVTINDSSSDLYDFSIINSGSSDQDAGVKMKQGLCGSTIDNCNNTG